MGVGGWIGREEPEEFVGSGGLLLKPFVYKDGKDWSVSVMHCTNSFSTWESAARAAVERAQEKRISIKRRRRL